MRTSLSIVTRNSGEAGKPLQPATVSVVAVLVSPPVTVVVAVSGSVGLVRGVHVRVLCRDERSHLGRVEPERLVPPGPEALHFRVGQGAGRRDRARPAKVDESGLEEREDGEHADEHDRHRGDELDHAEALLGAAA